MALRQLAKHLKNKVKPYLKAYVDKFPKDSRLKSKKQNQIIEKYIGQQLYKSEVEKGFSTHKK